MYILYIYIERESLNFILVSVVPCAVLLFIILLLSFQSNERKLSRNL
jgi:Flp pilus assembly protein protease CpaA